MFAATGDGGFRVRTGGTTGTAVTGNAAVDVDAQILVISRTNRFFRISARCQNAFSADTVLVFRTGDKTAARRVCLAEFGARVRIDTRTAANHFTGHAFGKCLAVTFPRVDIGLTFGGGTLISSLSTASAQPAAVSIIAAIDSQHKL